MHGRITGADVMWAPLEAVVGPRASTSEARVLSALCMHADAAMQSIDLARFHFRRGQAARNCPFGLCLLALDDGFDYLPDGAQASEAWGRGGVRKLVPLVASLH